MDMPVPDPRIPEDVASKLFALADALDAEANAAFEEVADAKFDAATRVRRIVWGE